MFTRLHSNASLFLHRASTYLVRCYSIVFIFLCWCFKNKSCEISPNFVCVCAFGRPRFAILVRLLVVVAAADVLKKKLLIYFFSLLFTIAGGLSVVLVVGDTWCAVTDPLRYHSRVSGLKSWILIASTWFISILFCIASAFRSDCRLITIKITSTLQNAYWRKPSAASEQHFIESTEEISHETVEFNEIYNLIYSCTFFVVIILLPICLVCAMYWKIFSEARQNGLRMRQNGSSPLLQSALNLATVPSLPLTGCSVIGEEDDSEDICVVSALPAMRRNSVASPHHVSYNLNYTKPILMKMQTSPAKGNRHVYHQQHRRYLDIPKFVNNASQYGTAATVSGESDPNHNSLSSTESTPSRGKCSFSGNGLMQFDGYAALSTESTGNGDLRQVHSTPDLQKSMNAEILAARQSVAERNSKKIHSTGSIHTTFPVQPPSICTPPKALSYMTSIRHRLSNASSIFKYREESRAARISILVVIMFLFSYFPYGLLVLLQGRVTFIANSSFLGVLFLLIASTSSPFIFAYRNRRVRRGVCRLFGVDAKTNERLQKQRILMRSTTHSSSCRDGAGSRKSPKAKIVRINRNTAKSASFAAPRSHIPCKYAPVVIPMTSDEYETPAIKSEFETDSFISNANHGICMPNDTDNDDDESDGIAKMIVDQYVPIEEVVLNQNMPLDLNEFVRIHNSNSSNNHVIKQKISLLKRVCKTSRKLSKCTSDASIERIYYDSSCTKCPPPVNVWTISNFRPAMECRRSPTRQHLGSI